MMFPTLSMWNGPKSDVCSFGFVSLLFVLFFFLLILSRIFFFLVLFGFVQALESYKSHSVLMLTAHISSNSKRYFRRPLSLFLSKNGTTKTIVPILYM